MTRSRKTKTSPAPAKGEDARSVVPADWRAKYAEHGGSCGDELAERLRRHLGAADGTIDLTKLKRLAEVNGVWRTEYAKLNAGLRRLSVGNRLRALVRAGVAIKWGRGGRPR